MTVTEKLEPGTLAFVLHQWAETFSQKPPRVEHETGDLDELDTFDFEWYAEDLMTQINATLTVETPGITVEDAIRSRIILQLEGIARTQRERDAGIAERRAAEYFNLGLKGGKKANYAALQVAAAIREFPV